MLYKIITVQSKINYFVVFSGNNFSKMMSILFKRALDPTTKDDKIQHVNNNTNNFNNNYNTFNINSYIPFETNNYTYSNNTNSTSEAFFVDETSEASKYLAIVGVFLAAGVSILLLLLIAYVYKKKKVRKIKPKNIFNPKYSQPPQKEEIIDFNLITQRLPQLPQKHKLQTKDKGKTVDTDDKFNDSGNNSLLTLSRASKGSVCCSSHGNSLLVECEVHDVERSSDGCYNNVGNNSTTKKDTNKNDDMNNNMEINKKDETKNDQSLTTEEKLDNTHNKLQQLQEHHRKQQVKLQQRFATLQLKRQHQMLQKRATLFPVMYDSTSLSPTEDDESQFKKLLNNKNNKLDDINNNKINNNNKNDKINKSNNKIDNTNNKNKKEKNSKSGDDSDDGDAYERELRLNLLKTEGSLDSYDRTFNPFFKEDDEEVWNL